MNYITYDYTIREVLDVIKEICALPNSKEAIADARETVQEISDYYKTLEGDD